MGVRVPLRAQFFFQNCQFIMSTNNQKVNKKWYAVHVRSNQERTSAAFIEDRKINFFLPMYKVQSKRKDRQKILLKPLFSGYLFVNIDYNSRDRIQVLKAPGTVRIVGFGDVPTSISDSVIDSIKILTGFEKETIRPHPLIRSGQQVEVIDGPFRGAIGVLHETSDRKPKLVVEIELLGRAIAVSILKEQVQPILT